MMMRHLCVYYIALVFLAAVAHAQHEMVISEMSDTGEQDEENDDMILAEREPFAERDHETTTNPKCRGFYKYFDQEQYELQHWDEDRSNIDRAGGGLNKEKPSCKSADGNARGTYTSHLVPCTFQFYQIPSEKASDIDSFTMSTACAFAPPMEKQSQVEDYVIKFPDECVADSARCYHLERDEKILLRHFCKYDWKMPEEATHISVDCTADKQEKRERLKNGGDIENQNPYLKHERDSRREFYAVIFGVVGIFLLAGCISLCFTYRYVIKPYLTANMKRSRSDPELSRLKTEVDSEKVV